MDINVIKKNKSPNKQKALRAYLASTYHFRYNEVANTIEIAPKGTQDFKQLGEKTLWGEVNLRYGPIGLDYLLNTVCSKDVSLPFNPIKTWLESLPDPTLEDPIKRLCEYVVLEDEKEDECLYTCLKKWFVGAIKTMYDYLYVHKQMVVFIGRQGIGKTPFFRQFLPEEMSQEYINDVPSLSVNNKDARIAISRYFITLVDEIDDFFRTADNRNNYKSYISKTKVNERLPFGKTDVYRPRIASFLGTSNQGDNLLNDPSGSQRFSIFSVEMIRNTEDEEGVQHFQKKYMSECWAQAYRLFRGGFNPRYSKEEISLNEERNEAFKHNSPEYESIKNYLFPLEKTDEKAEFMTSTQICDYLNGEQAKVFYNNVRLGKALLRLKFIKGMKKINKMPIYGYYVKKIEKDLQ